MGTTAKLKLKKGDQVVVLTGRSKGVSGKIDKINPLTQRAFVSGANIYKKHQKASASNQEGGIVEKPMSLHVSNIAFLDPKTKKATKLGMKIRKDGQKTRIAKASGTEV